MQSTIVTLMAFIFATTVATAQEEAPPSLSLSLDGDSGELYGRLEVPSELAKLIVPRLQDWQELEFVLGPRAGYLRVPDADRGTWTGGVQARVYMFQSHLAVEGSIEFHQDEFLDGDVTVTQYPVQVTGLVFPFASFKDWPIQPYGLGGGGWYYTHTNYQGSLSSTDDETDNFFGVHVGLGGEINLSDSFSLSGDFRWVFVDEPGVDNSNLEEEEWDFWQATAALNIKF